MKANLFSFSLDYLLGKKRLSRVDRAFRRYPAYLFTSFVVALLSACGGGGGGDTGSSAPSGVSTAPKAPSIIAQPEDTPVEVGSSATFAVTAISMEPLDFQWFKNGDPIDGAISNIYDTADAADVKVGDQYSVLVSNSAGSVMSRIATLGVSGVAPTTAAQPEDALGVAASNTAPVKVTSGTGAVFPATIMLSTLTAADGFKIIGGKPGYLGNSVGGARDVNGDGIADILVGHEGAMPRSHGAVYVVFGTKGVRPAIFDTASLNGANGFQINGEGRNNRAGKSVSAAGDVNGDGFDDITLGAPGFHQGGKKLIGRGYVVFGKASGYSPSLNLSSLNGANGFRVSGAAQNDLTGDSVSAAGDINGDGYGDFIVGAPRNGMDYKSGTLPGVAYVVFGKAGGFPADVNGSTLNGANGFRVTARGYASVGMSVSAAGDVNGDGIDDFIVGAPGQNAAYVIFGRKGAYSATLDVASVGGKTGFKISGDRLSHVEVVSAAGDINGDGFGDLIVGTPGFDMNSDLVDNSGRAYVVFGKAGGYPTNLNVATMTAADGFRIVGPSRAHVGYSVSAAGDVNGDGIGDFIVGAPDSRFNKAPGTAYVVFGKKGGFGGELNLASLNGANGFRILGEAVGDRVGISVSAAGDVNGDGVGDVIVGSQVRNVGRAYVIYGKKKS